MHGLSGKNKIEKNAQEKIIQSESLTSPIPGRDIYLTLDIQLQKTARQLMRQRRGAIVLINVQNGEILAAVSAPSFDPNVFAKGITAEQYQKLAGSADKPLFNRMTKGGYPPGSTIKPFIALAALEMGIVASAEQKYCPGYYQLPNHKRKFRDWKEHGNVDIAEAIAQSCDVYFYNISHDLGIDSIHDNLKHFGFGKTTGIDIPGEISGVLPSKAWKQKNKGLPWYRGETIITGIGQGFLTATPLQLAVATAALANRGILYKPRLLRAVKEHSGH